ncbi:MAG TPA: hypothetical protein VD887_06840 [Allosphingosinicella sp.]|nr:hypothetical protein [Allosphingosinicella sp.]
MSLLLTVAAAPFAQGIAAPPPTPEQAVVRQQAEVRAAIDSSPCRGGATPQEIVVCGELYSALPDRAARSGYDPSREFAAPASGPWFRFRRGPLSLTCCSVEGSRGTGAGLSLRLLF